MPRPILAFGCVLLLATGLGLIGLAQAVQTPRRSDPPGVSTANVEPARAFYTAVNHVLATGDAAWLDGVVAPDLVTHPARHGAAGRAGFVETLLAHRAVFPARRVAVDDLRPAGPDQIVARLRLEGGVAGSFLGRPVAATAMTWGPIEVLRIADGRVVERWNGAGSAPLFAPLWEAPFPGTQSDGPWIVALRRVTWESGAELAVTGTDAAWFVFVETGRLSVTVEAGSPGAADAHRIVVHVPGALSMVPPGAGFAARNDGGEPAIAVTVAVLTPSKVSPLIAPGGEGWPDERQFVALGLGWNGPGETVLAPGVVSEVLTTASGGGVPAGATLAVGRVVLAPGAVVALPTGGPLVLAVEVGSIDLGVNGGLTWTIGPDGYSKEVPDRVEVSAGSGALTTDSAINLWQTGEDPAVILVLAILTPSG